MRTPGTGVYLNARSKMTPLALRKTVAEEHSTEESVVVVSISTARTPHVPEPERLVIDDLDYENDGICHVTARFGFQDVPDVPAVIAAVEIAGLETPVDVAVARYSLAHVDIAVTRGAGMRKWRKRLFVTMTRFEASPIAYFRLPPERTVTIGSRIEF